MSYYLNPNNAIQRLRNDWSKHGRLIIAVDFDSTLVPYMDYEKESDFHEIRQLVRDLKSAGCIIIIFTASSEDRWEQVKKDLNDINISWDYFNQSPPNIPNIGQNGKVYANAYLDDRAGLYEVFNALKIVLTEKKLQSNIISMKEMVKQLSHI
jgi:hypothetical protein